MMTLFAAVAVLLFDVSPRYVVHHAANLRNADRELIGEGLLSDSTSSVTSPNATHRIIGELRSWTFLATPHLPLARSVSHVVGMCSEKHVLWVHTKRVVSAGAVVAHLDIIRDWSVNKLPKNPMDQYCALAFSFSESAVPIAVCGSGPQDAAGWRWFAESFLNRDFKRNAHRVPLALFRAKPCSPLPSEFLLADLECLAALFAGSDDSGRFGPRHDVPPDRFVVFRASRQLQAAGSLVSLYGNSNACTGHIFRKVQP